MATAKASEVRKNGNRQWKSLGVVYPEYAHIEVSNDGFIRNGKTLREYSRYAPNPAYPHSLYVSLDPKRGIPGRRLTLNIAKLVYEVYHGVLLPKGTEIKRKNGMLNDYYIDNLCVDGIVGVASIPSIVQLPTIKPEIKLSPVEQKLSEQERRWIERYRAKINDAVTMLQCASDITLQEIDELNLDEGDLCDVLMSMDTQQVASLILKLIEMAHGSGHQR